MKEVSSPLNHGFLAAAVEQRGEIAGGWYGRSWMALRAVAQMDAHSVDESLKSHTDSREWFHALRLFPAGRTAHYRRA